MPTLHPASRHLECFREKCTRNFPKRSTINNGLGAFLDSIKCGRTLGSCRRSSLQRRNRGRRPRRLTHPSLAQLRRNRRKLRRQALHLHRTHRLRAGRTQRLPLCSHIETRPHRHRSRRPRAHQHHHQQNAHRVLDNHGIPRQPTPPPKSGTGAGIGRGDGTFCSPSARRRSGARPQRLPQSLHPKVVCA
jgi:hypothetical protein